VVAVMTVHLCSAVHGGINAKLPRHQVKLLRQRVGLVAKQLGLDEACGKKR